MNQRHIVQNDLYSQMHNHQGMIEDGSYIPITGQFLQTSLPPYEQEFSDEIFDDSER